MTIRDEMRSPWPEATPPAGAAAWEHPLDRIDLEKRPDIIGEEPPPRWYVRRRRLLVWTVVVLALLGGLAGVGAWMAMGLQDSATVLKSSANAASDELTAFKTVARDDPTAARGHLDAAALHLQTAHAAADTRQMHLAGKLPYAKIPVSDLGHLLTAADASVEAGREALDVLAAVMPKTTTGGSPGIYSNNTFSLPVLEQSTTKAIHIRDLMIGAEKQLLAVDGTGIKEQEVPGIRDKALTQARDLRRQMEAAIPLLQMMPPMLGAEAPKKYLVTVLNQAEMRASGGAPLSVSVMTTDKGRIDPGIPSLTSEVGFKNGLKQNAALGTTNAPVPWTPVKGDAFSVQRIKGYSPFVTAGYNPDFRVAGESYARAWEGGTGDRVDGVISLDITAIRELLRVTGPVPSGYGDITADNVAQILLSTVYASVDSPQRHDLNKALMAGIVQRLASGENLVDKMKALAAAAPGRHIQVWMRDPVVQQTALDNRFAGAVQTPTTGDHIAVYAQNALSKTDALQERTVDEVVHLNADGSAQVERTVTQRNHAPDRTPGKQKGEQTGWSTTNLIHLLPEGATVTRAPAKNPQAGPGLVTTGQSGIYSPAATATDQAGRPVWRQSVQIAPLGVVSQTITFTIPKAAVLSDTGMTLALTYDPDNALTVTQTQTVVIPPAGFTVSATPDVVVTAGQGVVKVPLNAPRTLEVELQRG